MKKTILTSTLALGLGVTGFATGHSADAAENNVDQANLAQQAQNNPEQLNDSPVQDGSYNYDFAQNGTNYQFESDGENFNWSYNGYNDDSADESSNDSSTQQQTSSDEQPTQQAAPQTEQTQQPEQSTSSDESASSSSSDVNGHLQQIAQRESGGDTQAVNPSSGAAGKYQFLQSTWDSVAPSEYQGQSPTEAPEDVQDQAAQKLYDEVGADQWVTA